MFVDGLAFQIRATQVDYLQKQVVNKIIGATEKGLNHVTVDKKGFTPEFIEEMSFQGVKVTKRTDKYELEWEEFV